MLALRLLFKAPFFSCYSSFRNLHSFPTRRSSDLPRRGEPPGGQACRRSEAGSARGGDAGSSSDRKSTRLNSSHTVISYAVFCWKKKTTARQNTKDEVSAQSEMLAYQQKEPTARVA